MPFITNYRITAIILVFIFELMMSITVYNHPFSGHIPKRGFSCNYRIWSGKIAYIMVSVSVCQVGRPVSNPARSVYFRKVGFYQNVINLSPPPTSGLPKAVHVLSCLCDNACKRSLTICRKSRALCPISRLLSVPIWPAWAEQGR